ncbi:RNA polymerase sigma factor [Paenarthrobacter nitroguajacolicus]|uniref:RNA polymerase sigma factor n=1 Tax=Paenarthrobacter nitroguajacolicus TaxID=211146 RepID=A0A558H4B3_PAENT|nr:RNA polymerase sigma factor [Paenarthrobacter nitroguajacolicus]TVU63959.1 RNA polymerase sigma factor [Paenarthrobacter nitroguajacolicus]
MNHLGDEDAALWKRCVEGDADALGLLFDRHSDAVFRYCLSRTGSWHDAEELVSVTFLEAWRQRRNLALQRDSLLPWLLGVATNAARNSARSIRRYEQFLGRLPHSPSVPDHSTAADERLDTERQVRELLEGTTALTGGERDVLLLCVMNGYSYEEAAASLGVRIGTVRSRVNRAKKKLRSAAPHLLVDAADTPTTLESRLS